MTDYELGQHAALINSLATDMADLKRDVRTILTVQATQAGERKAQRTQHRRESAFVALISGGVVSLLVAILTGWIRASP